MIKHFTQSVPRLALILGFALLFFASCSLYKLPGDTSQLVDEALPENVLIPEQWLNDSIDNNVVSEDWYKTFNEEQLNELIAYALDTSNPAIVYRLARISDSRAQVQLAKSGRSIRMDYGASFDGLIQSNGANSFIGSGSLPISWEADLWGRIKAGILAADEYMLAETHQFNYTRQSIAAMVARLYFEVASIKVALRIGNDFLEINERLIEVQEAKEKVGVIDMQDVHLAKANLASINDVIALYENLLQTQVRQLERVMGKYPENALDITWEPKLLPSIVKVEDPLSMISRRPDLLSLESQVRGAFFLSEQAELAKYPTLVLSANPGISTSGGFLFGMGASLFGPILNGKAIRSQIESANAYQRQVASLYGSAILDALQEVETSLAAEAKLQERLNYAYIQVEESRKAYEIAVEQYRIGQIDLYYVLLLQAQYLLADLSTIQLFEAMYLQRVQLHMALGGTIN